MRAGRARGQVQEALCSKRMTKACHRGLGPSSKPLEPSCQDPSRLSTSNLRPLRKAFGTTTVPRRADRASGKPRSLLAALRRLATTEVLPTILYPSLRLGREKKREAHLTVGEGQPQQQGAATMAWVHPKQLFASTMGVAPPQQAVQTKVAPTDRRLPLQTGFHLSSQAALDSSTAVIPLQLPQMRSIC